MADPVATDCPADTWTKVATNVTAVTLHILNHAPKRYSFSYVGTAGAAPSVVEDAVPVDSGMALNFAAAADVWVYAHDFDGRVRVDS